MLQTSIPFQEWPPSPGAKFDSSILMWSFADAAFWRGKHVSMAEIIGLAKSISVTRFREAILEIRGTFWLSWIDHKNLVG